MVSSLPKGATEEKHLLSQVCRLRDWGGKGLVLAFLNATNTKNNAVLSIVRFVKHYYCKILLENRDLESNILQDTNLTNGCESSATVRWIIYINVGDCYSAM